MKTWFWTMKSSILAVQQHRIRLATGQTAQRPYLTGQTTSFGLRPTSRQALSPHLFEQKVHSGKFSSLPFYNKACADLMGVIAVL